MSDQGETLDKAHAALTRATRRRQRSSTFETALIAGAAILIAVSTAFSAWNTFELSKLNRGAAKTREVILLGTECLVAELTEHRHLNGLGHRADAAHHGYTYPIAPGSEPPAIPGVLENVCKTFLQTTTTTTKP